MLTRWRRPTMYPTIAVTAAQTSTITNEVASANGPMLIANGLTEVNLQSRKWGDKVARPLLARRLWPGIVFQRCARWRRGLHAKHHFRLQTGLAGYLVDGEGITVRLLHTEGGFLAWCMRPWSTIVVLAMNFLLIHRGAFAAMVQFGQSTRHRRDPGAGDSYIPMVTASSTPATRPLPLSKFGSIPTLSAMSTASHGTVTSRTCTYKRLTNGLTKTLMTKLPVALVKYDYVAMQFIAHTSEKLAKNVISKASISNQERRFQ